MKTILNFISKENISILVLVFINFLFAYKYLIRYTEIALVYSIASSLFYLLLLANSIKLKMNKKLLNFLSYGLILLFIIVSFLIFKKIEVLTLNVDRWSVITSFWDALFNSEYPYYAKSNLGNRPGPMPIYFLLAFPFYLIKELGGFSLLGLIILPYIIGKTKASLNYKLLIIIFVITSTYYLWEIVSRSNLFTNSLLIVWFLINFIERKNNKNAAFYFSAVIAGLLLSTRAVFIIPYIIVFMYSLRKKELTIPVFLIYTSIAVITFFLTFLPFILMYPNDFFKMNPFIIQSTFLIPSYYTMLFILIAFVFSFLAENKNNLYYYSGLALFIAILIYFIYHIITSGFNTAYFESNADISYFIFCIPFFIIYLSNTFHDNMLKSS